MANINNPERDLLKKRTGINFPQDFFDFWEFTNTSTFHDVDVGMMLTGPFILLEYPASAKNDNSIWEDRYYNDPPEFITVATGQTDGLHWGYYIDDPEKPPFSLAYYYSSDAFEITEVGYTMFEVLRYEMEQHYSECEENIEDDPDNKDSYQDQLAQLNSLRADLPPHGTGDRLEIGSEYLSKYETIYPPRQIVAPTRDGMGIVVSSEAYVPLTGLDIFCTIGADKNFTAEQVQLWEEEAMTLLRQGYPGAALKLGKDLWIYKEYHATSYLLLDAAYSSLGRPLLQKLLKVAIEYRRVCDAKERN